MTHIFYHNDMDGKCAANVINFLYDNMFPSAWYHHIQYGMEFPLSEIDTDDTVIIVDYSIEPGEMAQLLKKTKNVVWIDHHITAIEKYANFPEEIRGLRNISKAGCELTWDYFTSGQERISNKQWLGKEAPEFVKLIGDRDIWAFKYGDRTKWFYAGICAEDTFPKSPAWDDIRENVEKYVENGKIIQKYKESQERSFVKSAGFWVKFMGYNCYAINGRLSSEPFEAVVPEADIWMPFCYTKESDWTVSLYSQEVDVSEIAKQFVHKGRPGGGHKGAAGFQCDYPPFLAVPQGSRKRR